jgi:hypothetical protein
MSPGTRIDGALDAAVDALRVTHVQDDGERGAALVLDGLHDRVDRARQPLVGDLLCARGDHDARAVARERVRDRLADAAARPGDDRDLALELLLAHDCPSTRAQRRTSQTVEVEDARTLHGARLAVMRVRAGAVVR